MAVEIVEVNRQLGNYNVVEVKPSAETNNMSFAVYVAGTGKEPLSFHSDVTSAVKKVLIYQDGDNRRNRK